MPQKNQLALEIESVKAGLVPIPLDSLLQEISRQFETEGWHVEWRQANGNDVLVVHLDGEKPDQPMLESIEVREGVIRISGRRQSANENSHFETPRMADQSAEK